MSISVRHVVKRFGPTTALAGVSLEVPGGQLAALLGPSGSGKTTLLRIIAGLETADAGEVFFEDQDASRRDVRDRNIGFVFQHYALFRHMTVAENVGFGLKVRGRPRAEVRERVAELLRLIQLESLADRYPAQLSGGQRQRVALARALAPRPRVLLLDEPFGALDARVRQELRDWLRRLHDEIHVTSVFVTHDQEEALELADRVAVMNHGRIEQVGTPEEVYQQPANPFVMKFLGQVNLFHGRLEGGRVVLGGPGAPNGPDGRGDEDGRVVAYARPHQLDLRREPEGPGGLAGQVARVHAAGVQVRVEVDLLDAAGRVEVVLSQDRFRELALRRQDVVYVYPREVKVFEGLDYVI
jgi:sulfate transport system ATP-binding protein